MGGRADRQTWYGSGYCGSGSVRTTTVALWALPPATRTAQLVIHCAARCGFGAWVSVADLLGGQDFVNTVGAQTTWRGW